MTIVSVRVSHELSLDRLLAVPPDLLPLRLWELRRLPRVRESLLLSAPGRLEIFVAADSWTVAGDILETLAPAAAARALCDAGPDALHHLFRLAANLDTAESGDMLRLLPAAATASEGAGTFGPELRFAVTRAVGVARGLRAKAARAREIRHARLAPGLVHKLLCDEVERIVGEELPAHVLGQSRWSASPS